MAAITLPAHAASPLKYVSSVTSQSLTQLRQGPGIVHMVYGLNNAASPRFLKFYDRPTATPPVLGTDSPFLTLVAGPTPSNMFIQSTQGFTFQNGLWVSIALTYADTDVTTAGLAASDLVVTFSLT